MTQVLEGIVRSGKIELIDGPELAEGQRVRVVIESETNRAPSRAAAPLPEEGVVHTPAPPALVALLDQVRRNRPPLPSSPHGPGRKSAAGTMVDDPTWDEHLREILESRKAAEYREIPE